MSYQKHRFGWEKKSPQAKHPNTFFSWPLCQKWRFCLDEKLSLYLVLENVDICKDFFVISIHPPLFQRIPIWKFCKQRKSFTWNFDRKHRRLYIKIQIHFLILITFDLPSSDLSLSVLYKLNHRNKTYRCVLCIVKYRL